MKKLAILLVSFILSTGVAIAAPSTSSDCGDDDVKPITISKTQN